MAPLFPTSRLEYLARRAYGVLRRPRQKRDTSSVLQEYSAGWDEYRAQLAAADSYDDWIGSGPSAKRFFSVNGKLEYSSFDFGSFYRDCLLDALRTEFSAARSVTEFGSGVGRNLLFLKDELPEISCSGYELCQPGVDVANAAAEKFGFQVQYAQLDYLNDGPEKYVFPRSDVGFTMFSLEQLPQGCSIALEHILDHVELGSIHIEPVVENYPMSLRGILGRIEHRKVDYLSGFDAATRALNLKHISVRRLDSAHNPLMFPSVYVLRKH
ncbi:MAG: hypothetical protein ACTHM2_11150 [Afipia sp.]